ncbi:MAG: tetratricopeptide repeat protein [Akkermansiaceae bacterium]
MKPRLVVFLSALLILKCGAHYDVNAAVEKLTAQIKAKPTAELYYQRAIEFRALRETIHAEEDLRASLKLAAYPPSLEALAKLLSQKKQHEEALKLAHELIERSPTPHHQLVLADLAFTAGKNELALEAIVKGPPAEDDTHLLHSHLLFLKEEHQEAAAVLKNAHQASRSIVLRNAWLDAAIVAVQGRGILPILDEEIVTSRFTASHRIRRAAVDSKTAKDDLQKALVEINSRLNPKRPDLTLLNDRRKAYLLLGEKDKAAADLARMKQSGLAPVGPWLLRTVPVE